MTVFYNFSFYNLYEPNANTFYPPNFTISPTMAASFPLLTLAIPFQKQSSFRLKIETTKEDIQATGKIILNICSQF